MFGSPRSSANSRRRLETKGNFLKGGDDDGSAVLQSFGQLPGILVDLLHHAVPVFELVYDVLQLLVQDKPVGDDDHAVEDSAVFCVVQGGEAMCQPRDGVAFSAARRMLDQIIVAGAFHCGSFDQSPDRPKLVVAGKDHGLFLDALSVVGYLLFDLQVQKAGEQIEQTVALEDLLPQVGRTVVSAFRVGKIPRSAVATLVERKKTGGFSRKPSGHPHRFGIHREMHQGPPLEGKYFFPRISVSAVLEHGVFDSLSAQRIFQFQGGDGNAVDAQDEVQGLFIFRAVAELSRHPYDACVVSGVQIRVESVGGLEKGRSQQSAVALETVPQRSQRTLRIQPFAQIV